MCTQHCVMASHEIITSVFDVIVVVVAVVVLQLHTIQASTLSNLNRENEWTNRKAKGKEDEEQLKKMKQCFDFGV